MALHRAGQADAKRLRREFQRAVPGRTVERNLFTTLDEARQKIQDWQHDYNHRRPHSGLGNIPPVEFMAKKGLEIRAAQPQKSTRGFSEWPEESRGSGQV
ncbi:hypothetical protein JSE7799_03807 [Jannaschia seosinensis]|uniref:Integrase catalytic domain-containing protein n=1 Tax=Jannaschia seosinensis TaxID=313367 RepID=A0A0M7BGU4_9RHOB|nr:hypothetical protein JSE7799_03807 [Jannaschia seosinensis]